MRIADDTSYSVKSITNREKGMKKSKTSRGRYLVAGVSAAAAAAGLGGTPAHAQDADRHRIELGFGISRLHFDAPTQTFVPGWKSAFDAAAVSPLPTPQDRGVEDAEGWQGHFALRPRGGPWTIAGEGRFGKTDGAFASDWTETVPEVPRYAPSSPKYDPEKTRESGVDNFATVFADNSEEFQIVDFKLGRDVGIGAWGAGATSRVGLGLKYAEFESTSEVHMYGVPTQYVPPAGVNRFAADAYEAHFSSSREFEGWGPTVSWDASTRLFGSEGEGRVLLDWHLDAGVLFGKQKTEAEHTESSRYYEWKDFTLNKAVGGGEPVSETTAQDSNKRNDDDAKVSHFGARVGLSYRNGGVKVSLGYRAERYRDVLDGGIDDDNKVDRSMHGPYLRFTLGFGGDGESEQ